MNCAPPWSSQHPWRSPPLVALAIQRMHRSSRRTELWTSISSMRETVPDAMVRMERAAPQLDLAIRFISPSPTTRHSPRNRRWSCRNLYAGVCATLGRNADRRPDRRHHPRNSNPLGETGRSARRHAPPYAAQGPGDPKRGADVYGTYCSSCHGADGHGGKRASSIVDGSYLALVSDQNLRTTVIVGRHELGAPDWRGDVPGKPMSPEDVSDVVAWLAAQRAQFPGQPYSAALHAEGGIR